MKKWIIFCLLLACLLPNICYGFNIKNISIGSSGFFCPFWQKQGTAVAGTWEWGADPTQTNFASVTGELAGKYRNTTHTNLDEYKWSSVFLPKGTYKITIIYIKYLSFGIAEVLFGTTSLDTKDMYAASATFNQLWEITFTLTSDTTADLRFRTNGTNPLSGDYYTNFSRFQIEKTN